MALTRLLSIDSVGDAVYSTIRDAIISGELKPGTPLRVPAIAQQLGVSRSPVREAIIRLTTERLAHSEPRLGAVVTQITRGDLTGLYEIREVLEGLAGRLSASMIDGDKIKALGSILVEHEKAVRTNNIEEHVELDLSFHRLIRQSACNSELVVLLNHLESQVRLAMLTITVTSGPKIAFHEHTLIYDAIEAHDPDLAEKTSRAHIARLRNTLLTQDSRDSNRSVS